MHSTKSSPLARTLVRSLPALLSVACATARQTPRSGGSVVPQAGRMADASAHLRSVLAQSDVPALTRLFPDDAILVTSTGDTIRSAAAVARYLTDARAIGAQAGLTTLDPGARERCQDGVIEMGRYYMRDIVREREIVIAEQGTYASRWQVRDGEPRLVALVLRRGIHTSVRSFALSCRSASERLGARHVQLFVTPLGVESRNTTTTATQQLRARGFRGGVMEPRWQSVLDNPPQSARSRRDGGALALLVGARVQLKRGLSLEAGQQLVPSEGVADGVRLPDSSYVVQRFSLRESNLLLSYRYGVARLGLGASRVAASWKQLDGRASLGKGGLMPAQPLLIREGSTDAVGLLTQAGVIVGASSRIFGEMTARARFGARGTVPAVGTYPAWTAKYDVVGLGFSIGVAF